jgi:hypothetical protein
VPPHPGIAKVDALLAESCQLPARRVHIHRIYLTDFVLSFFWEIDEIVQAAVDELALERSRRKGRTATRRVARRSLLDLRRRLTEIQESLMRTLRTLQLSDGELWERVFPTNEYGRLVRALQRLGEISDWVHRREQAREIRDLINTFVPPSRGPARAGYRYPIATVARVHKRLVLLLKKYSKAGNPIPDVWEAGIYRGEGTTSAGADTLRPGPSEAAYRLLAKQHRYESWKTVEGHVRRYRKAQSEQSSSTRLPRKLRGSLGE